MPHQPLNLADQKRIDKACVAFESAWAGGGRPRVEAFLPPDVEDAARAALLRELVLLDAHYRAKAGERPAAADYQARFTEFDPAWLGEAGTDTNAPAASLGETGPAGSANALSASAPAGYEILGELGRGGMGLVYKARDRNVGRVVALKMIRSAGLATPLEQARFQLEVDCAARVHHPNIVTVFGAGTHLGQPYVVLEYVEGGTLRDWKPGGPGDAARLAATIAEAVQALHAQGVVHRDLKPTNVLLAAAGTPKVTDFGLAKPAGDAAADLTATGQVVGTPAYMSPEQASGERNVGPAADVYALGAILYELLTGRPPFTAPSVLQLLEQVRSAEPPPPRSLSAAVPRDLEVICLKCLAKAPARRYTTAGELADDLRRFLNGEPIRARPVGAWERGVKLARRKPGLVALSAALALVIAGSLAGLSRLYVRAERERKAAVEARDRTQEALDVTKAVTNFFLQDVLLSARPTQGGKGRETTVGSALDAATRRVEQSPPTNVTVHAAVRAALGLTYGELGDYPRARRQLEMAVSLRRDAFGDDFLDTLEAKFFLANILFTMQEWGEAERLFRYTGEGYKALKGEDDEETLNCRTALANLLTRQGRLAEAEAVLRPAAESARRVYGAGHVAALDIQASLAILLRQQERHGDAEALIREVVERYPRAAPEHQVSLNHYQAHHGGILLAWGKFKEAKGTLEKAVAAARRLFPPGHPGLMLPLGYLAAAEMELKDLARAEPLFREVLKGYEAHMPGSPLAAYSRVKLGECLTRGGKFAEAENELLAAQADLAKHTRAPPSYLKAMRQGLVSLYTKWGKAAEAEKWKATPRE